MSAKNNEWGVDTRDAEEMPSDPCRIRTPTAISSQIDLGRRVFSFSNALDESGRSLDSMPESIPELESSEDCIRIARPEPSVLGVPGKTIHELDLDRSLKSDSAPESSSGSYSSRTLAIFKVKLEDSKIFEDIQNGKRKPVSAFSKENHKNDKWVHLSRAMQQKKTQKQFPILLRWPSKVFAALMLIFAVMLLVVFDEKRLLETSLADGQYVNTTGMCVHGHGQLTNYIESKGLTWIIISANIFPCSTEKNRSHSQYQAIKMVSVCLCKEPSENAIKMSTVPHASYPVQKLVKECHSNTGKECLTGWESFEGKSLKWDAGPNGVYVHGESIDKAKILPWLPESKEFRYIYLIWGGTQHFALRRLSILNALIALAFGSMVITFLWFLVKVQRHRKESGSTRQMYNIS